MEVELDLKGIAELLGPLKNNSIIGAYGASQVGKSTLWLQIMFDVSQKTKQKCLWYDTEGGAEEFLKQWTPIYKKRYPDAEIHVRMKRDWRAILKDHGTFVRLKTSAQDAKSDEAKIKKAKGGKISLVMIDQEYPSPMVELVQKEKYAMVFYDSLTMPMKPFGSEQQNFPARAHAENLWFHDMLNIIDESNAIVVVSHHSSKNPADPYAKEQMAGGMTPQFYSKILVHMKKETNRNLINYRKITLARYFSKEPNIHYRYVNLTNQGYIDVKESEVEELRKRSK